MKIKNILRSLKKVDNHTATEIDEKFPMSLKTDEIFERSYEKYLLENNRAENETTGYVIRKTTNPAVGFARVVLPLTACIGIFVISGKIFSVFSKVEKNNENTVENNYTTVSSLTKISESKETLETPETEEITTVSDIHTSPISTEKTEVSSITTQEITTVTVSPQVIEIPVYSVCSVPKVSQTQAISETIEPVFTQTTIDTCTLEYTETLAPSSSVAVSTEPTVTQPVIVPNPAFKKKMYMDTVIKLAEKGHELTWADFKEYDGTDVGSGIYIMEYQTDIEGYVLYVSGAPSMPPDSSQEAPDRIYLTYKTEDRAIDIRDESVIDFVYPGTPGIDYESRISKVTVTSGTTVELNDEEISHMLTLMKNIRTGREDRSINEYTGQYISIVIDYENGDVTELGVFNPFFVVNGTPYRTLYEPCLELHVFLWEILSK